MKIATYNINGINGRLQILLRWLEEAAPDVVCLQELKASQEKFPEQALLKAGYHAVWSGEKAWNGVAILSRSEDMVLLRNTLPGDKQDVQSRYIEAIVHKIVIGCLYLPNGNPAPGPKFDYKLAWLKRLKAHAKTLLAAEVPVILAGDYNVIPTDKDVYNPERWKDNALFLPQAKRAFHSLLKQGWTDALRQIYPEEQLYTFWDYLRHAYDRNAGLRLDHFLLSPQIATRLRSAGVDKQVRGWAKSSDHAPAWITLKGK